MKLPFVHDAPRDRQTGDRERTAAPGRDRLNRDRHGHHRARPRPSRRDRRPVPDDGGVILVRARPLNAIKLLGAAMAAGGAAYLIATAPFVPKSTLWWTLPILAGNPGFVWLWARATFDDDFVVRRWHGALWLIVVGIAFSVSLGWTAWPALARAGTPIAVAGVAGPGALGRSLQTVRTWSADLVAGRRRLRLAILTLSLLFIGLLAGSDLMSISSASSGIPGTVSGSLPSSVGLLTLAALADGACFIRRRPSRRRCNGDGCFRAAGVRPDRAAYRWWPRCHRARSCCAASTI